MDRMQERCRTDSMERMGQRGRTVPACSWNAGYLRLTGPYPYGLWAEQEETAEAAEEADAEALAGTQVSSWQHTSMNMDLKKAAREAAAETEAMAVPVGMAETEAV